MNRHLVSIVRSVDDTEGNKAHEKDAKNYCRIQAAGVIENPVRLWQGERAQWKEGHGDGRDIENNRDIQEDVI